MSMLSPLTTHSPCDFVSSFLSTISTQLKSLRLVSTPCITVKDSQQHKRGMMSPATALLSGLYPIGENLGGPLQRRANREKFDGVDDRSIVLYSINDIEGVSGSDDLATRVEQRMHAFDARSGDTTLTSLTGVWKKDRGASDSMDEACDMVALPWIFRKALMVLNTLEVKDTEKYFSTIMKAGGLMDVVEKYPWSGEKVKHGRRDKRRGKHLGCVYRTGDGHPCIEVTWNDPYGGHCTDEFRLHSDGMHMEQLTFMRVKDKEIQYRTVFHRVLPKSQLI